MVCCAVLVTSIAEPDPKKYKPTLKKNKPANTTLTAEERDFLREVETKFGIKPEGKEKKDEIESKSIHVNKTNTSSPIDLKLPFPAVIAIEIVNDTDTKSQGKGKRTIDANLGYGYKTNSGYSYTYFGKPKHDHGKFMIYPYSQEDIKPTNSHTGITDVEITPSNAFELVENNPVSEEKDAYHYPKPAKEFKTNYDDVKGLVSPPPSYSNNANSHGSSHSFLPSTLYTTYNGHELSGLSGQFPTVMPNYFVDSSQLLRNPEYQNVGLTNDHLRSHGSKIADQRVVPVLVLRVPSSSLKNPTAELFANLPSNYPLSRYLNNVNLQGLVNQYFKKQGYSFAPQVMHYQHSLVQPTSQETPTVGGNYGRQHYATPHVQPSYTQSDHSGVQYSAVQPVMARYPSSYTQRFNLPHGHSLYHQPLHQQKFEYRYQYVPQHVQSSHPTAVPQTYYIQPQYQQQTHEAESVPETNAHNIPAEESYEVPQEHTQEHYEIQQPQQQIHQTQEQDTSAEVNYEQPEGNAQRLYEAPQQHIQQTHEQDSGSYEYRPQSPQIQSHEAAKAAYAYLQQQLQQRHQQQQIESASPSYGHQRGSEVAQQYYTQEVPKQTETEVIHHPQVNQEEYAQSHVESGDARNYQYQQQSDDDGNNLVLSENYPSKDHTIATVLPVSYTAKQSNVGAVQSVSYVTPMPYSSKYQSPYRIMVPQTFLNNPSTERVAYVNSHSVSAYTQPQKEHNPEAEYTIGPHHIPPIGKQKPPSYPRNYHSHSKRLAKPENKTESTSMFSRKQSERNEKKKL